MVILLMAISVILLVVIGGYSMNGYWWLLMVILLMVIGVILLMAISSYFINGYWLLFY